MAYSLTEIAQKLKGAKHTTKAREKSETDVKVQLIYAFNGTGKTRLSGEFKKLIAPKNYDADMEQSELSGGKYIYYNAFTEDLFYWDNDLEFDSNPKLKIHPNSFTKWILEEQGQENNIIKNFQFYTDKSLTPLFNEKYTTKDKKGNDFVVNAYSEVTFSYKRGNNEASSNIKISKGEERNFIWCVFYSLLELVIEVLNVADETERETNRFDQLEYVFIDDPVSSLDDNHLIELAVNLAQLIKKSESNLKFIITTHSPLFYNVLHNEFKDVKFKKYFLKKTESGEFELNTQSNDSPFSYHLFLLKELDTAIESGGLKKYHFNFLRNILEKTSTFLGYNSWGELLPKDPNDQTSHYETRIINLLSHAKQSSEEANGLKDEDKRVLERIISDFKTNYKFKK